MSNLPRAMVRADHSASGRARAALTSNMPIPTSQAYQSGRSRMPGRNCQRIQYFRAIHPCLFCRTNHTSRASQRLNTSQSTRSRKPSISCRPRKSRRRSHPCRSIGPIQPARSSHPSMRSLPIHLWTLLVLANLASIVRIFILARLGSQFRQVASVSIVRLRILTIIVSLFRLRIPSVLSILGRLFDIWSTIGYDR